MLERITADLLIAGQAQHGTLILDLREVGAVKLVRSVVPAGVDLSVRRDGVPLMMADLLRSSGCTATG